MLGGAAGSLLRHLLTIGIEHRWSPSFPWATLIVNVLGSFGIGLFAGLVADSGPLSVSSSTRLLVMVGIFGGFTTFSSFSLQTLDLLKAGHFLSAASNILLSVALCLLAVWLGSLAAKGIVQVSVR